MSVNWDNQINIFTDKKFNKKIENLVITISNIALTFYFYFLKSMQRYAYGQLTNISATLQKKENTKNRKKHSFDSFLNYRM